MSTYALVVPTVGRPSLQTLLDVVAQASGPPPAEVVIADDRPRPAGALDVTLPAALADRITTVRTGGRGPAAARNAGWLRTRAPWVVFLDDDVEPTFWWRSALVTDLQAAGPQVGGVQGRIEVPLPAQRRPTDWERQVAGLAEAAWATADMAYRRAALTAVGGFDERFRRAYREDADLALRVQDAGWLMVRGQRRTVHPVRSAPPWVSVRRQVGNADDPLMRALHGADWRTRAHAPPGRRPRHVLVTAALVASAVAATTGRTRTAWAGFGLWAAGTAEFAWARIAPGPRTLRENMTMAATSVAIPPAATWHWLRGLVRVATGAARRGGPKAVTAPVAWPRPTPMARASAVLFDRDGTLIVDEPYNGDPDKVRPVPGAQFAVDALRAAGIATAVVSNQSGVGRGLLTADQVRAVNERIERELGPLGPWCVCPHAPEDGCGCRKPLPGLIAQAAAELGLDPGECVVIGDIGSDMEAAAAAGARGILVPTPVTREHEVATAPCVAPDLATAVRLVLEGAA